MAWYDTAVFYHIYPLGLCGCAHENDGQPTPGAFTKLNAWAEHASKDLGCTAIYIGPLFESGSHGYDTIDYRRVDRRLGTNEEFREFVANCHARGQKVIVDGVFNHVGRDFFAFKDLQANRGETPVPVIQALEPLIQMVSAMNIPVLMIPGFEADDVIGSAAVRFASDDTEVYMVTPDKDYGQLVSSHIFQFRPGKSGAENELWGEAEVCCLK